MSGSTTGSGSRVAGVSVSPTDRSPRWAQLEFFRDGCAPTIAMEARPQAVRHAMPAPTPGNAIGEDLPEIGLDPALLTALREAPPFLLAILFFLVIAWLSV